MKSPALRLKPAGRIGRKSAEDERAGVRLGPGEVAEIPLDAIVFSPYQPRKEGDREIGALCESIRQHGVLQPVVVRRIGGGYELVAGERRVRAARLAGFTTIPAVVRDMSENEAAVAALIENLQREGLNPLEEAEAFRRLVEEFGFTQEEVARSVGLSQPAVANKMRLLRLPEEVRDALRRGCIGERHARALLRLGDREGQLRVLERVVRDGLNVSATEELVERALKGGERGNARGDRGKALGRRIAVVKDLRIFLNAFKTAVQALKRAGVEASMEVSERDDRWEVIVKVEKVRRRALEVRGAGRG